MISVLLLVAIFAVSLNNCLPTERAPTVTVMITNTTENITLYHKGGDWVQASDLEVIVSNFTSEDKRVCKMPALRVTCSMTKNTSTSRQKNRSST